MDLMFGPGGGGSGDGRGAAAVGGGLRHPMERNLLQMVGFIMFDADLLGSYKGKRPSAPRVGDGEYGEESATCVPAAAISWTRK
jgi:hypothetical protein